MTTHASLSDDLAALRAHYAVHMPADIAAAMRRADAELAASDLLGRALGAGEFAPDFTLPDADGRPVSLGRALRSGPVIVAFYRGGWCPYCNLELRAYQARAAAMRAAGVTLIAVSPQTPDATAATAKAEALDFDVVSDFGSTVARAFGIAFDLADELRPLYARLGHALPDRNGDGWTLPVPATFVIAPSGEIALAFVDTDYRRRLDPDDAIAAAAATVLSRAA
jgi:peroxiredoxin